MLCTRIISLIRWWISDFKRYKIQYSDTHYHFKITGDVVFPISLYHTSVLLLADFPLIFSPRFVDQTRLTVPNTSLALVETRSSYRRDFSDESSFLEYFCFSFPSSPLSILSLLFSLNHSPHFLSLTNSILSLSHSRTVSLKS